MMADAAIATQKLRALVIGIDIYPKLPESRQLRYGASTARVIGDVILERVPFATPEDVLMRTDQSATSENVIADLDHVLAKSRPGDTLLVYFSGHAENTILDDGSWIMSDGSSVAMSQLFDRFSKSDVSTLVISDATYLITPLAEVGEIEAIGRVSQQESISETKPTQVFISHIGQAIDNPKIGGTFLGAIVIACLNGASDRIAPACFAPILATTRSNVAPNSRGLGTFDKHELAGSSADVLGRQLSARREYEFSDGFVTVRELVRSIQNLNQYLEAHRKLVVQGTLGSRDVVLTKSALPVD